MSEKKYSEGGNLARSLGLAGMVLLSTGSFFASDARDKVAQAVAHNENANEKIVGHRFKLDKFDFIIPSAEWSEEDIRQLEVNIRLAYQKLAEYFGEEVLVANYAQEIIIRPTTDKNSAGVASDSMELRPQEGGGVEVQLPTTRALSVDKADNLRTITHELGHIAVQWNMPGHSSAFVEGHMEALEAELGFEPEKDLLSKAPELAQELGRNGWDMPRIAHSTLFEEGDEEQIKVIGLLRGKWRMDWLNLLKKDPDFLRKFYKQIAKYKASSNLTPIFSKDGLYEVAQGVYPGFKEWRNKEGISTKPTWATEQGKIIFGKMVEENRVLLVNLSAPSSTKDFHYGHAIDRLEMGGGGIKMDVTMDPDAPGIQGINLPPGKAPTRIKFGNSEIPVIPFSGAQE